MRGWGGRGGWGVSGLRGGVERGLSAAPHEMHNNQTIARSRCRARLTTNTCQINVFSSADIFTD